MTRNLQFIVGYLILVAVSLGMSGCVTTSGSGSFVGTSTVSPPTLEARTAESLADVELAWHGIEKARASGKAAITESEAKYSKALETFLVTFSEFKKLPTWTGTTVLTHAGHSYTLDIPAPPSGHTQWAITDFDSFRISSQVKIKSMSRPTRIAGLGAPLVLRKHSMGEPYVFRSGYNCPATAVIDFQNLNGPVKASLRLYDPREKPSADGLKLAADYGAPVEIGLNVSEFRDIQFGGVFSIQKFMKVTGLYLTEPYRPDKIPVVFVHGLNSSPLTWTQMINDVNADPALSTRYQYWYYSYPTGTGWTISAPKFREELNGAQAFFAPKGGSQNLNRTILVGHSLGGLMSRMMCIDSGDDFWHQFFNKPQDQVDWPTAKARDTVINMLYFKKVPMVSAAVFIAAPHRGSGIADWFIVNWIKKLIKLPAGIASSLINVATLNVSALKITIKEGLGVGTSISGLSPKNPAYIALNNRVILVPFYTIIGDHDAGGNLLKFPDPTLLKSNDTVVPYWSSHLNEAVSERIIHAKHTMCTFEDGSVAEVKRILAERLAGKLGKAPTKPAGQYGPDEKPDVAREKAREGEPVKMKAPAYNSTTTSRKPVAKPKSPSSGAPSTPDTTPAKPVGKKAAPVGSEPVLAT